MSYLLLVQCACAREFIIWYVCQIIRVAQHRESSRKTPLSLPRKLINDVVYLYAHNITVMERECTRQTGGFFRNVHNVTMGVPPYLEMFKRGNGRSDSTYVR